MYKKFTPYNDSMKKNGAWKRSDSEGDKGTDYEPKTFSRRMGFYYINFIDKYGKYDSDYSERFDWDKQHASNKARWYTCNTWALTHIPYQVVAIGLYDSHKGHVQTYRIC